MGSSQQCNLRWNEYHTSLSSSFSVFRNDSDFIDVTFACDGQSFSAHKVVISACSVYLKKLLKANPCQHPIVILNDVKASVLSSLLYFMYHGVVEISQNQLGEFLHAGELLEIKGLFETPSAVKSQNIKLVPDSSDSKVNDRPSKIVKATRSTTSTKRMERYSSQEINFKNSQEHYLDDSASYIEYDESDSSHMEHSPNVNYMRTVISSNVTVHPTKKSNPDNNNHNNINHDLTSNVSLDMQHENDNFLEDFKQEPVDDDVLESEDYALIEMEKREIQYDILTHGSSNSNSSDLYANSPATSFRPGPSKASKQPLPNECPYCGKIFKWRHNMSQHVKNMHQYKPIEEWEQCKLCDQQFKTKGRLSAHLINKHGVYARRKNTMLV